MEICWGWSVGDAWVAAAVVGSDGEWEREGASEDVDMMRGMSDVERYMLKSFNQGTLGRCSSLGSGHVVHSAQPYALGAFKRPTRDLLILSSFRFVHSSIVTSKQL